MLEMRGETPVDGAGRPAVAVGPDVFDHPVLPPSLDARAQLRADLTEHRLDGEDHSLPQLDPPSPLAVVVDLRVLVHAAPDAVPDEVADDMEPARLRVLLHHRPDVAKMAARAHLLDRQVEAFLRRPHQLLRLRRRVAYSHRD